MVSKIIDGHSHMINVNIIKNMLSNISENEKQRLSHEFTEKNVEEHKKAWLDAMDKLNIEKTIFMGTTHMSQDFIDFINSSDRFYGMAPINPSEEDALAKLEKEIKAGMSGVKMYPSQLGFDVGDSRCYPIYEFCEKHKLPIVIHFGVSIGRAADLRYGNPVMLSRVLRDFPNISFVIAHFGAGYFREVLMLKYKQENLFVDSSGTNNWMIYQDNPITLRSIFKKTIEVFGSQGIIFGSDTRIFPNGYRESTLKDQLKVLDELNLKEEEKENIMYNNAKRILLREKV